MNHVRQRFFRLKRGSSGPVFIAMMIRPDGCSDA